jgi:hypothetical protein
MQHHLHAPEPAGRRLGAVEREHARLEPELAGERLDRAARAAGQDRRQAAAHGLARRQRTGIAVGAIQQPAHGEAGCGATANST